MSNNISWEEWKADLVRLAGDIYGEHGPIEACGEECWRKYYDSEYSPQNALEEDISCA